jgi:hypothetical protein
MQWEFTAARASQPDGTVAPVPAKVLVAAVYRPQVFPDGPTLGEPPQDLARPSADVAYPLTIAVPPYPPLALAGSVVMFELEIDDRGAVSRLRPISSDPGFDSAAMDAIWTWKFRAPAISGRPVRSTAYVIFGFPAPQIAP